MKGETERDRIIRDIEQEIGRCRRAADSVSDNVTLERLNAYLKDLEHALRQRRAKEAT